MNPGTSEAAASLPAKVLRAKAQEAYATQSRDAREQEWILKYLPLVRHVVQKITANFRRGVDVEDLISAGTLGLVKAAKAYDPAKHTEFKTYAYIRIRGAILDELRSRSFVPSAVHRVMRRIREAFSQLSAETGRAPEDQDLAAKVGLSLDKFYQTLEDARHQHFLSIHGLSDGQPALDSLVPTDPEAGPEHQAERHELMEKLTRAIQEMPERDRTMILLYYERDLTMKEVAEVLQITESRVSQMHAAALFRLSMKLRSTS